MKYFNSTLLLLIGLAGTAQKKSSYYPGYIIYSNNDTFFTKIGLSGQIIEMSDLFTQVTYIDSTREEKRSFPGKEISGFGFQIDSTMYDFYEITIGNEFPESGKVFAWKVVNGHIKLYYYGYDGSGERFVAGQRGPATVGYDQRYVASFVQKGNEKLVRAKSKFGFNAAKTIYYDKKWLKDLFKDDKELVEKIGKKIATYDIEAMIKEYNAWFDKQKTN